ncbi:MAG: hypothetical protein O3A20_03460 [Planctomycetota bacterium]|nr:hypothetical protein [Planctomycetota bacterium]
MKELRRVLENRKPAAFVLPSDRDSKDAQRKSAKAGDEVVFFNFRDAKGSEADGSLHFGAYLGQDVSAR